MKRHILFLILILLSVADANALTTRARFVKSGCSFNGDGTVNACAASGGAAGAHQTLTQVFTANAARNITAAGNDEILDITVSGATLDPWDGDYQGIISDSTHYVDIHGDTVAADGAHAGLRDNARFRISNNRYNGTVEPTNLTGCSLRIRNIQVVVATNTDASARGIGIAIRNNCPSGDIRILGNLISYESGTLSVSSNNNGIYIDQGIARTTIVANNVIKGFQQQGILLNNVANEVSLFYNNTITGNVGGGLYVQMYGALDTVKIKNNYLGGNTGNSYTSESTATTFASANNLTSDATSPDGAGFQSKTCTFLATGSMDYHLTSGATNCIANAVDLSADSSYPFSNDFVNLTRTVWDIGAAKYVASILTGSLTTMKVSGAK